MGEFNNKLKYNSKSPCLNCIDREVGCHSTCSRYLSFKNNIEDEKKKVREFKAQHNAHMAFLKQQKDRQRKHHR